MNRPASRLLTLILLLQRRPNQKAGDLAEALGVSVRTFHRYIETLDEMGIPVYTERGPQGGFSLVRGYRMPPLIFTPQEAVAVYLGTSLVEEMWGLLYQEAARGVLAKLDNLLPDEQRQEVAWARRSLVATGMHRGDPTGLSAHLEKLRRAVRERRQVNMVYHSGRSHEAQERDLDPYALVHRWGWWYVIGYCHKRQARRSFRLDRIVEMALLDKTFQFPEDFDVRAYLDAELGNQPQVQARMRFAPQAAHVAWENRSYWDEMEQQPDGSIVVSMSAPDLTWAASSALAYGPIVAVLEPPELRQLVREWAGAVMNLYRTE